MGGALIIHSSGALKPWAFVIIHKMFSPSHLLLVFVLLIALLQSASSQNDERPIYMDRREASPFGDILTEIKGKGLGGRMRFGKRAFRLPSQFRPRYEPVNNYY